MVDVFSSKIEPLHCVDRGTERDTVRSNITRNYHRNTHFLLMGTERDATKASSKLELKPQKFKIILNFNLTLRVIFYVRLAMRLSRN